MEKLYLARVQGHPPADRFSNSAPIRSYAGQLGSRDIDKENGLNAHTDFEVIERSSDGTALLTAVPATGRTNQIRLHLWESGWPIVGDQLYLAGRRIAAEQPVPPSPLRLFAKRIAFTHPLTRKRVVFEADSPNWADAIL